MTAPFRQPRPGLRALAPEIERIIEALARVQEERDHTGRPQMPTKMAIEGGAQLPGNPANKRYRLSDNGTTSET